MNIFIFGAVTRAGEKQGDSLFLILNGRDHPPLVRSAMAHCEFTPHQGGGRPGGLAGGTSRSARQRRGPARPAENGPALAGGRRELALTQRGVASSVYGSLEFLNADCGTADAKGHAGGGRRV